MRDTQAWLRLQTPGGGQKGLEQGCASLVEQDYSKTISISSSHLLGISESWQNYKPPEKKCGTKGIAL